MAQRREPCKVYATVERSERKMVAQMDFFLGLNWVN